MNQAARERALRILDKRDVSRRMLIDKLTEKDIPEADALEVADWLCDLGVINDERFAGLVVRHYAAKGYGEGRIRAELSRRGISRELWDDAVDSMPDNSDKMHKFISARLKDPNDRDQVRKVSQALYRRGYSWEDIRSALNSYNADTEEY